MTLFHSSRSKVVRIEFRFQIEFSVPEVQYGTAKREKRDFWNLPSLNHRNVIDK